MAQMETGAWRVADKLIEQPSWGGDYIIKLKGLQNDEKWAGKKVGQSFEMSKKAQFIGADGAQFSLQDALKQDAVGVLGQQVVDRYGPDLSLLIKLTQAKGNSFQVHLPVGDTLGHWLPKPEAWFYLAPGLYTFGLKAGTSFDAYGSVLRTLDDDMKRLSAEVKSGRRTVDDARLQAQERIQALDPFAYVNTVVAQEGDIIDLTAGGIHHSWEQDDARFPDGNLVYEVQQDVDDKLCSMRGFDKGKFLDDGSLRDTHVEDYLKTVNPDPEHNELSRHIRTPQTLSDANGAKTEALFRTPYFALDRVTLKGNATLAASTETGFHHVFVHGGNAKVGTQTLEQGRSYFLPGALGDYTLAADGDAVLFRTFLSVD